MPRWTLGIAFGKRWERVEGVRLLKTIEETLAKREADLLFLKGKERNLVNYCSQFAHMFRVSEEVKQCRGHTPPWKVSCRAK